MKLQTGFVECVCILTIVQLRSSKPQLFIFHHVAQVAMNTTIAAATGGITVL